MDREITPAEVVQWFLDAKVMNRPIPTEKQVASLVQIARFRAPALSPDLEQFFPGIGKPQRWVQLMRNASPHLAKAKAFLLEARLAFKSTDEAKLYSEQIELITTALTAIGPLLDAFPPRKRGQRGRGSTVTELTLLPWAEAVRDVLLEAGWANADISGDDAAVPFVVSKMVSHVFGDKLAPNTIARQLRHVRSLLETAGPAGVSMEDLALSKQEGRKRKKRIYPGN